MKLALGGVLTNSAQLARLSYHIILLRLLRIGIPYGEILNLSEDEVYEILAVDEVIREKEAEALVQHG